MTLLVGISGKIASGKDYLTEKLTQELSSRGATIGQTSFAKPLKNELTVIIDLLKELNDSSEGKMRDAVAKEMQMTSDEAAPLVTALSPELCIPTLNGWSRTLGVRSCLQTLGTEIRRGQDRHYWSIRLLDEVGQMDVDYAFVSDLRFPDDASCVVDNGGVAFRLDIPEEVLQQRRMGRDGINYSPEQLNHISETALDDYDRFDYFVGEVVEEEFLSDIIEMRYRLQ